MNPNSGISRPLTFDELLSLASFLAERGDPGLLYSVLGRVAYDVAVANAEGATS